MRLPSIPRLTGLAGLAAFLRARLGEVGDSLAPLWSRRDDARTAAAVDDATRELAVAVVGAAAPFASTSYGRARLLRQMHASGLLTAREAEQAEQLFGVAQ